MYRFLSAILLVLFLVNSMPAAAETSYNKEQPVARAAVPIVTEAEARETLSEYILFYTKSGSALCYGTVLPLSEDNTVKPYLVDETAMVPLAFLCERLSLVLTEEESGFSVTGEGVALTLPQNGDAYTVNGSSQSLPHCLEQRGGVWFVPAQIVAATVGFDVYTESCGYILIGENTQQFSFDSFINRRILYQGIRPLIYKRPDAETIVQTVESRYPDCGHPRLWVTNDRIERIKELQKTDANVQKWIEELLAEADTMLKEPVLAKTGTGTTQYLNSVHEAIYRMEYLPMAYRLTGNEAYAERAKQELLNLCGSNFEDWSPVTLFTGEMCAAVALGYDWLYQTMTEAERQTVRNILVSKAFEPAMEDYQSVEKYRSYHLWWNRDKDLAAPNNWSAVCNGGLAMAALAVCDETEIAGDILENGLRVIEDLLERYAPDGAYFEGLNYWIYSLQFLSYYSAALTTAAGTDYGLFDAPGLDKTSYYLDDMSGFSGVMNLRNVDTDDYMNDYPTMYIAQRCGDSRLVALRLFRLEKYGFSAMPEDLFWYEPTDEVYTRDGGSRLYREQEVAVMRTGTQDEADIFVGFHGSEDNQLVGVMDAGTYVVDMLGERWVYDSGPDMGNYVTGGATAARNNNYRSRAEGHNTFVIDPDYGVEQDRYVAATINRFENNEDCAYAVCDLSGVYAFTGAESAQRGILLDKKNQHVVIQDEVKRQEPMELYWFMHTDAAVTVANDGKSAVLTLGNKHVLAEILSAGDYSFSVMDAVPLATSPQSEGNVDEPGKRKLVVHAENTSDFQLTVCLTPLCENENRPMHRPSVRALENWSTDLGLTPEASAVLLDGEPLESFKSEQSIYAVSVRQNSYLPQISATAGGTVSVVQADTKSLTGKVVVKIGTCLRTYLLCFVPEAAFEGEPEGAVLKEPYGITSSEVTDDMLIYRQGWNTAAVVSMLDFDFGCCDNRIDYLALKLRKTDKPREVCVLVSNDKTTWQPVFQGRSYADYQGLQGFVLKTAYGRYVRLLLSGIEPEETAYLNEARFYASAVGR